MTDGHIEDQTELYADSGFSMYYFNQSSGYWEPAIEPVLVTFKYIQNKKKAIQNVHFHTPVNMNASVQLCGCLSEFQRLWNQSSLKARKLAKRVAAGHKSVLHQSYNLHQKLTKKVSAGDGIGQK